MLDERAFEYKRAYFAIGKGFEVQDNTFHRLYLEARSIHAFMLQCEGLSLGEIANRIESIMPHGNNNYVTKEAARCLVIRGARRLNHAMRKTRFRWVNDDGPSGWSSPLV